MTYNDLISILSLDKNIVICKKECDPQLFGNFVIEFKYKKKLLIQMLNDRGIIEISIVVSSHFISSAVPLKYAVNYMQKVEHKNEMYTFPQIDDAYSYFGKSINILNEIIKSNTLKIIAKQWKSDHTY